MDAGRVRDLGEDLDVETDADAEGVEDDVTLLFVDEIAEDDVTDCLMLLVLLRTLVKEHRRSRCLDLYGI